MILQKLSLIIEDYESSDPWWQRTWFVKFIVVICILFTWIVIFGIGYWFIVIFIYIKDEPVILKFSCLEE
jgi:hypothetical protein